MRNDGQLDVDLQLLPTVTIPLDKLVAGPGIRAAGVNRAHVYNLASCGSALPPILVQEGSLRVIDGLHRVQAARDNGENEICARILDVDDAEAFLRAVTANVAHGLPLTLSDRKAAAARLLRMHPEWSDRALGRAAGISGKTVGVLRTVPDCTGSDHQARVGLDGRERPIDGASRREVAQALLAAEPDAPLREIGRKAGISPGTVRKIRRELHEEQAQAAGPPGAGADVRALSVSRSRHHFQSSGTDPDVILEKLRRDPSLRYRAQGRDLLRMLQMQPTRLQVLDVMGNIPAHWVPAVAALARIYAREWLEVAGTMERPGAVRTQNVAIGDQDSVLPARPPGPWAPGPPGRSAGPEQA